MQLISLKLTLKLLKNFVEPSCKKQRQKYIDPKLKLSKKKIQSLH